MNTDLLTLVLLGLVTATLVFTKTNVAFVIFALCGGYVLSDTVGSSVYDLLDNSVDPNSLPLYGIVNISLLILPALIMWFRFRRSQRGGGRLIQQIIPAFGLALLLIVLLFANLPDNLRNSLKNQSYFLGQIESFSEWIIIYALGAAMFDVLTQHGGPKRPYKRHKKNDDF